MISRKWVSRILNKLFGFEQRLNKQPQLNRYYRPQAEVLEDRATPAALFYVDNSLNGTALPLGGIFSPVGGSHAPVAGLTLNTNLFNTINDAIAAASDGDTILVADGTYNELIEANKSLTIRGNQFGVDARNPRGLAESVISNSKGDVRLNADNVTIDGFTLTGVTVDPSVDPSSVGVAIWSTATNSNIKVLNNIITNNLSGIFAESDGSFLIQHNLFDGNTQPGISIPGVDIYAENSVDLTIDANKFVNNTGVNANNPVLLASTALPSHTNVKVTNNDLNNAFGIFAIGISGGQFENNSIVANDPGGATALTFGGLSSNISVKNNVITSARGLHINDYGVDFTATPYGDNTNIVARDNSFNNSDYAIGILGGYSGTFDASANYWGADNAALAFVQGKISITDVDTVIDYTPWYNFGADSNLLAPGFQPDRSSLTVTNSGAHGAGGRMAEATGLLADGSLVGNARIIRLPEGTMNESFTLNTSVTFDGAGLVITPTIAGNAINVTANNVTIKNVTVTANIGPADHGINAIGVSGLTLENVIAINNSGDGVHGENLAGITTIIGGTYDNNGDDGLDLDGTGAAAGLVLLDDLNAVPNTANTNGDNGLVAQEFGLGVGITNWRFNDNSAALLALTGDGIELNNVGAVTTTNVTATGNDPGILINGAASYIDMDGNFSDNDEDGIRLIDIVGNVSLTRTKANNNNADLIGFGSGVRADDGNADLIAIGGTFTVNGGEFRDTDGLLGLLKNQVRGIWVDEAVVGNATFQDAAAPVQAVAVDGNSSDGVLLATLNADLTVNGGTYNNNGGVGFRVNDGGASATFTNGTYSGNAGHGLELNQGAGSFTGSVTLTNVNASNNLADGLHAITLNGTTNISGGVFNGNTGDGISLDGNGAAILVLSDDANAVANTANNNGDDGLAASDFGGTVGITNWSFNNNGAALLALTGDGIELNNVGAVTTTNVTATGNDPGILINGAASYTDVDGNFSDNDEDGIRVIDIVGNVSLTRTKANDNNADLIGSGSGVRANDGNADLIAIGGTFTVNGGEFRDTDGLLGLIKNQVRGIWINSAVVGTVTFQNAAGPVQAVAVDGNSSDGVLLASLNADLTVSGGSYNNNGGVGFRVNDGGTSATFTDGSYSSNTGHGLELNQGAGSFTGSVTLTNVNASNNLTDGLHAITLNGTTTISGGVFNGNTGDGISLDGNGAAILILSDDANAVDNTANNNGDDGLAASDFGGTVGITRWFFNNNGTVSLTGDGVQLSNVGGVTTTKVTVSGNDVGVSINTAASFTDEDGVFTGNATHGIQLIDIAGQVSLTRTTATDNDANFPNGIGDGVFMLDGLVDADTNAVGSLVVTGGTFSDTAAAGAQRFGIRVGDGIGVHSVGTTIAFQSDAGVGLLQHVNVTGNLSGGVDIRDGGTTANFSGNGNYSNNTGSGVFVGSLSGTFTATDGTYDANTGHGIQLTDITGLASVTRTTLTDNGGDGLNANDGDADTFAVGGLSLLGVTITETAALGNVQKHGVFVGGSNGNVTLNDSGLKANLVKGNTLSGVTIGDVTGAVSITSGLAAKYELNSGGDGIHVDSLTGALTVSGIFATDNTGDGLEIGNGGTTALIDNNSTFSANKAGSGINLNTVPFATFTGTVTLNNVFANFNSVDGIHVRGIADKVSFDTVNANNNLGEGLDINVAGLGSLIKASVFNNNRRGMLLNGAGSLAVENSTFNTNNMITAIPGNNDGAGIRVDGASLSLTDVTISGNTTNGPAAQGGGIQFNGGTNHTILRSTIDNNTAAAAGAGINLAAGFLDTVNATNTTVSTNTGDGVTVATGTLTLNFATVAFNTDPLNTAVGVRNNGLAANLVMQNALLANNAMAELSGPFTNNGTNLIQNATDLARLAPLSLNYGGTTRTHALLPGSAALDRGTSIGGILTDQRGAGFAREVNVVPDIGAFESKGFTVTRIAVSDGAGTNDRPQSVDAADDAFRTLITKPFVTGDGSTALQFAASVTALDTGLADLTGGALTFLAPTGAVPGAVPTATQPVNLTNNGGVFSAQTGVTANAIESPAGVSYPLVATTAFNTVIAAPGPNTIDWRMFNQIVNKLTYAPSAIVTAVGSSADLKIQITTSVPHLLLAGQQVYLTGVDGNPAANGTFTVFAVTSPTSFSLAGTVGGPTVIKNNGVVFTPLETGLSPRNAASGEFQFGGMQFKTASGALTGNLAVLLLDQNVNARPVVIKDQKIVIEDRFGGGTGRIDSIDTLTGFNTATVVGGKIESQSERGIAGLTNMRIFKSGFPTTQLLRASFTNPDAALTVVTLDSTLFKIVPIAFQIEAGAFAGAGQTVFNVTLADSTRGQIRLVSVQSGNPVNGLGTNQIRIRALDYVSGDLPLPIMTFAPDYSGDVRLTFNIAVRIGAVTKNKGEAFPFTMTNGEILISDVVVLENEPLDGFRVRAEYTLIDPIAGDALVNFGISETVFQANFVRSNLGRQRGR